MHAASRPVISRRMDASTSHTRTRRIWRESLRLGVLSVALASPLGMTGAAVGEPGRSLRSRLDRILTNHNQSKAVLGARVIALPDGQVLYDRNGTKAMLPASNMKPVVMSAAIDQLGADFQFKTVLAVRGIDLVVIGEGDPTFGDERLARRRGQTITATFRSWAETLKATGVRQIPGDVVIDDSIFDDQFVHPSWPADQLQKWYEAPIGGLNFNANCTAVRVRPTSPGKPADVSLVPGGSWLKLANKTVSGTKNVATINRQWDSDTIVVSGMVAKEGVLGPVTVRDPGLYFGDVLKTVLSEEGIQVVGGVVRERVRLENGSIPAGCHIVAVHRAPLADALSRAGKESLGMMAEALMKLLGSKRSGVGSWESGRQAVDEFLDRVGVSPSQVKVVEGSGLSRSDRLSAAAATQVFRYMYNASDGNFEALRDSLACAGIDGTMKKRCRWPDTKGRIFAKTGYIKGVRTLAGYIHTTSDRWLAFAFFYNQAAKPNELKKLQDEACRLLVRWPDVDSSNSRSPGAG